MDKGRVVGGIPLKRANKYWPSCESNPGYVSGAHVSLAGDFEKITTRRSRRSDKQRRSNKKEKKIVLFCFSVSHNNIIFPLGSARGAKRSWKYYRYFISSLSLLHYIKEEALLSSGQCDNTFRVGWRWRGGHHTRKRYRVILSIWFFFL